MLAFSPFWTDRIVGDAVDRRRRLLRAEVEATARGLISADGDSIGGDLPCECFPLNEHFPGNHFDFKDLSQIFEGSGVLTLLRGGQQSREEYVEIGLLASQRMIGVDNPC